MAFEEEEAQAAILPLIDAAGRELDHRQFMILQKVVGFAQDMSQTAIAIGATMGLTASDVILALSRAYDIHKATLEFSKEVLQR